MVLKSKRSTPQSLPYRHIWFDKNDREKIKQGVLPIFMGLKFGKNHQPPSEETTISRLFRPYPMMAPKEETASRKKALAESILETMKYKKSLGM